MSVAEIFMLSDKLSSSAYDLPRTLSAILDVTLRLTRADRGAILLLDDSLRLKIELARDRRGNSLSPDSFQYTSSIVEEVLAKKRTMYIPDLYKSSFRHSKSSSDLKLLSVLCIPLKLPARSVPRGPAGPVRLELPRIGEAIGVLYVDSTAVSKVFSEADLAVFEALTNNAMTAIVNAKLFELHTESLEMKRSLEAARKVQEQLMPRGVPRVDNFDVAGWSYPCSEAGGDYFDYLLRGDDKLIVVVGDVSGHGIASALTMAGARASLRALLDAVDNLPEAISRLNNFVRWDSSGGTFMTLFLGVLDTKQKTLEYVNAGHDDPFLFRSSTGKLEMLGKTGMALGFVQGARYRIGGPLGLEDGDVLLAATDGVWEARNDRGEQFGKETLGRLLAEHQESPAAALAEKIYQAWYGFVAGSRVEDDTTLVAVKTDSRCRAELSLDLVGRAMELARGGKVEEAFEHLVTAIKEGQRPDEAYYSLGVLWCEKRQWDKAIAELQKCLAINPVHPVAVRYLELARERAAGRPGASQTDVKIP